jgi:CO/xanthine dehydrogenase FAD-binding subunit
MKIKEYSLPININDAYEQLISQRNAVILGGGMFLRLQNRTLTQVIDLSHLGLDAIETVPGGIKLGAMVTLRQIETCEELPVALRACTRQIAGLAVRNMATIGGSVMGRYPFSDVLTALAALKATLHFHRIPEMAIADFLDAGLKEPDVLTHITVPMVDVSLFLAYKPVYTDFSLVNLALVKDKTKALTLSMGATPNRAVAIPIGNVEAVDAILNAFEFGTDHRAGSDYRRALAKALLEDALKEVETWK